MRIRQRTWTHGMRPVACGDHAQARWDHQHGSALVHAALPLLTPAPLAGADAAKGAIGLAIVLAVALLIAALQRRTRRQQRMRAALLRTPPWRHHRSHRSSGTDQRHDPIRSSAPPWVTTDAPHAPLPPLPSHRRRQRPDASALPWLQLRMALMHRFPPPTSGRGRPWTPIRRSAPRRHDLRRRSESATPAHATVHTLSMLQHMLRSLPNGGPPVVVVRRTRRDDRVLIESADLEGWTSAVRHALRTQGWQIQGGVGAVTLIPPAGVDPSVPAEPLLWAPLVQIRHGTVWHALDERAPLWVIAGDWQQTLPSIAAALELAAVRSAVTCMVWDPHDMGTPWGVASWVRVNHLAPIRTRVGAWQWQRQHGGAAAAPLVVVLAIEPYRDAWRDLAPAATALVADPTMPLRLIIATHDPPDGVIFPWRVALTIESAALDGACWPAALRPPRILPPDPGSTVVWRADGRIWRGRPADPPMNIAN